MLGKEQGCEAGLWAAARCLPVLVAASVFTLTACLFNGEQLPTCGMPTKRSSVCVFALCFPELTAAVSNILSWSQPPSRSAIEALRILLKISIRVKQGWL